MSGYNYSGNCNDLPGFDPEEFDDETDYDMAKKRKNKLNQTNYVIEPRRLLNNFHQKTHFRASNSISMNLGCMKIKTRLFNQ